MKMKKQSCAGAPCLGVLDSIRFSMASGNFTGLLWNGKPGAPLGGLIALLGWQPAIRSKTINEQHGLRKVLCRPPIEPKQYARAGSNSIISDNSLLRNIIIMYALHP
jgi:hypothetical protein